MKGGVHSSPIAVSKKVIVYCVKGTTLKYGKRSRIWSKVQSLRGSLRLYLKAASEFKQNFNLWT